jgi:hypothetical protein
LTIKQSQIKSCQLISFDLLNSLILVEFVFIGHHLKKSYSLFVQGHFGKRATLLCIINETAALLIYTLLWGHVNIYFASSTKQQLWFCYLSKEIKNQRNKADTEIALCILTRARAGLRCSPSFVSCLFLSVVINCPNAMMIMKEYIYTIKTR